MNTVQQFSSCCSKVAAAVNRYEQCISCSVGGVVRRWLLLTDRYEQLFSSWCCRVVAAAGRWEVCIQLISSWCCRAVAAVGR